MCNGFNKALWVGLSRTGVALVQTSGWRHRRSRLVADAALTAADLVGERLAMRLSTLLGEAKCAGLPATVVVSDEWARLFLVTPPRNASRLRDCHAAAAMRFQALYGEPVTDWQLEADWHARHPFLACALPRALVAAICAAATKHRITVTAIAPQFIAAWNQWHAALKPDAWFGLIHANILTLGAIDRRRLCALRATAVPTDLGRDQQWLVDHVSREALRMNLPAPARLQLCGPADHYWAAGTTAPLTCEHLGADETNRNTPPMSASVILAHSGGGA